MDDTLRLQDRKYNEGFDEEQVFEDKQVLWLRINNMIFLAILIISNCYR
jgi:hypothetical protein